jgi:hypothetical protein
LTERLQQTADLMAERARLSFEAWRDANRVSLAEKRAGDGDVSVRWRKSRGLRRTSSSAAAGLRT